MDNCDETPLRVALGTMAPTSILIACRTIRPDDAGLLRNEELTAVSARNPDRRRASGAARHIARALMAELGCPNMIIGRQPSGAPVWPAGIKGSLAHDQMMAVAAISADPLIASVGIDVEAAESLPDELASLVMGPADNFGHVNKQIAGRAVFAAKEAVYKATYPLDGLFLDYGDISINLDAARGATSTGHVAQLYWSLTPRIIMLAVIPVVR